MPGENITVPKAPADWKPSPDQQRRIQGDPRLQRLSRDELYLFFGGKGTPQAAASRAKAGPSTQPQRGGLGAILDRVTSAMGGR